MSTIIITRILEYLIVVQGFASFLGGKSYSWMELGRNFQKVGLIDEYQSEQIIITNNLFDCESPVW